MKCETPHITCQRCAVLGYQKDCTQDQCVKRNSEIAAMQEKSLIGKVGL